MATYQTLWLWWGGEATERERAIWREFVIGMAGKFPTDRFMEAHTEDGWEELCGLLAGDGWMYGYTASGIWSRITAWTRQMEQDIA